LFGSSTHCSRQKPRLLTAFVERALAAFDQTEQPGKSHAF
jgi:hypothetical protein